MARPPARSSGRTEHLAGLGESGSALFYTSEFPGQGRQPFVRDPTRAPGPGRCRAIAARTISRTQAFPTAERVARRLLTALVPVPCTRGRRKAAMDEVQDRARAAGYRAAPLPGLRPRMDLAGRRAG